MFNSTDYRVWDKEEKKWWTRLPEDIIERSPFGELVTVGYRYVSLSDDEITIHTVIYNNDSEGEEVSYITGYAEVNHFIGVRDKLDNKVYENDLVADNIKLETYQVVYNQNKCAFMLLSRNGEMVHIDAEQFEKNCTVIGNIYEVD